jgi:3-oxoacyl-[acyl-carrier-protein] synthase II
MAVQPFDLNRSSALPGEGAAFFLLSRAGSESPKYCMITEVAFGNFCKDRASLPLYPGAPLFLGLDGNESCSRHYAHHIPERTPVAAYAQIYGSLPVGPAFDMAIAAMALKDGRAFGVPQEAGDHPPWDIISSDRPLGASSVSCVKFDCHGNYGVITLAK